MSAEKSAIRYISKDEMKIQNEYAEKVRERNEKLSKKPLAFVETYGCQQNFSDSERIKGMLFDMGFDFCENPNDADFILYNTCAVRENAELRVFGNLGALKLIKRRRENVVIAVCGCMIQQEHIAERIYKKYKHVDLIFGTHALYRFPQLLHRVLSGERTVDIEAEAGSVCEGISSKRDGFPLAKVPVMYGCNNYCTYCIVPYVRGRERSREAKDIIDEVKSVAKDGYKEVMLLGQNVNSYGNDKADGLSFPELLRKVCEVDGIERVRFMTSNPKDLSDELIEVIRDEDKVCNQLHIPIQSGSDRILKLMNRKYTRDTYLEKIRKVKEAVPDIVLTTDIIVGFPGETNEDFEMTLDVLREVEYDTIFSFIYSKRVGTPAEKMEDCMTEEEKHRNFERMLDVQNEISKRKNLLYEGKVYKVLTEGESKTDKKVMTGRTEGGKVVNFAGDISLVGKFVNVKITKAQTWSLFGEVVSPE